MMNFGQALEALKADKLVARSGWTGKGMFLGLVREDDYGVYDSPCVFPPDFRGRMLPWIGMQTAQGDFVPWLASQTDVLAEDWVEFTAEGWTK